MNKKWEVEFKPTAFKELKKLDRRIQNHIFIFLERLIENHTSPRAAGLALRGKGDIVLVIIGLSVRFKIIN